MTIKIRTHIGMAVAVALSVSACGGSDRDTPPEAMQVSLDHTQSWIPANGTFIVNNINEGDTLQITEIKENGVKLQPQQGIYTLSNGTLAIDGINFTYVPIKDESTILEYTVSNGKLSSSAMLTIAAPLSDPLAYQQWHLNNTGQSAYAISDEFKQFLTNGYIGNGATEGAAIERANQRIAELREQYLVAGEDMNVIAAYAQGVTGNNTIAVVVDSGLDIRHEDLVGNILPNRSVNLNQSAIDATDPTSLTATGDHGTSVAGLIAAKGWNGLGGRGVAPDAKLIGMNYLGADVNQSGYTQLVVHGFPGSGILVDDPVVTFNRSYGVSYPGVFAYSSIAEEMQRYSATVLRSGLGAVNVKSAGNGFRNLRELTGDLCAVNGANALGLTCQNANFDQAQATPYNIVVGAVNSNGKHTSYSTAGANLLVSAPAGEYGHEAPAMVTTDQMSCMKGYSSFPRKDLTGAAVFAGVFPFNNPGHPENPSCNYTATFNGTSSAAPNTSGVVALIAEANPQLSFREIRDVLVRTSTKIDPENAPVELDVGEDGKFVAHSGWVTNAAGHAFNNLYGFGRVNADAAVKLAFNYDKPLGEAVISDWIGNGVYSNTQQPLALAIPDNSAEGATVTLEVAEDITLEGVQFKFTVRNPEMISSPHPTPQDQSTQPTNSQTTAGIDLAIEVTSPAGTKSVLLSSKQALTVPSVEAGYLLKDSVLLSNTFYGENARGTWTIRLLDTNAENYNSTGATGSFRNALFITGFVNNTVPSVLDGVSIRPFGH